MSKAYTYDAIVYYRFSDKKSDIREYDNLLMNARTVEQW